MRWRLLHLVAAAALAAFPRARADAATTVRFEIDMRDEIAAGRFDPARDVVGVRGGTEPLSWQRTVPALASGDGRYALELRFGRAPFGGQPVQYKFRIEREGRTGAAGWEAGRNHPLLLSGPSVRVERRFGAPPQLLPPRRTGRIERLGVVPSRHVAPREVQVWLPPGYGDDPGRRHPVLILHDGQNVFDGEAAGAEWMVDETAHRLVASGRIEPPIIVAVHHAGQRITDYTPTRVGRSIDGPAGALSEQSGGGAGAYGRFLVEELKPLIDARYRTRTDAASTAVGGSSLGALVSLWLVLEHPQSFGAALVVSPALWWDGGFARRDLLARSLPDRARPRIWLDIGALEGEDAVDATRQLRQALMSRGWSEQTLAVRVDDSGAHDEASWASRVEDMLLFLYGRRGAAR